MQKKHKNSYSYISDRVFMCFCDFQFYGSLKSVLRISVCMRLSLCRVVSTEEPLKLKLRNLLFVFRRRKIFYSIFHVNLSISKRDKDAFKDTKTTRIHTHTLHVSRRRKTISRQKKGMQAIGQVEMWKQHSFYFIICR